MPSIDKCRGRWSCRVRKKNGSSIRKTFDTKKEALAWGANWLANVTRGTNDFAHCSHLIYLHNKHPNPALASWLGVGNKHHSDANALTELIQWVWRSRIRKGEPITLYFAAKRMRQLFEAWLGINNH